MKNQNVSFRKGGNETFPFVWIFFSEQFGAIDMNSHFVSS